MTSLFNIIVQYLVVKSGQMHWHIQCGDGGELTIGLNILNILKDS